MNRPSILVFLVLVTFATKAIDSKPPRTQSPGTVEAYVPDLGAMMDSIQLHHAKLWFAGKAGNWELSAYELNEIRENFAVVVQYRDQIIKEKQIAAIVDTIMVEPIAQVEHAVSAKDHASFEKAFDDLTTTCNSCHRAAGYPFISDPASERSARNESAFW